MVERRSPKPFVGGSNPSWPVIKQGFEIKSMKLVAKPVNFLKEVKVQLSKVAWPTRKELIGATGVVIVITLLAAIFIGVVDLVLSRILTAVFQ